MINKNGKENNLINNWNNARIFSKKRLFGLQTDC